MSREADERYMKLALRLARKGEGRTSPNPMVGAVIVRGNRIAGAGWHRGPGEPHAEALALAEAGARAAGATAYVTLEPCAHHGRTPPCTGALISARVKRVVAAMADPDPLVDGGGIRALRAAGIDVEVGALEDEARRANAAYIVHRTLGRPFVTYKSAASLDGRIAARDGTSQWITGAEARRDVQRLRSRSDAIMVGIGTVLADDPSLTVRGPSAARPRLRVVVDSAARTPPDARVISPEAPKLIVTVEDPSTERVRRLVRAGAEVLSVESEEGRVALLPMLRRLAERGVMSLLLEGGGTLAGAFAAAGLIDRYLFYVAPKLIGGGGTLGALEGWAASTIGEAAQLRIEGVRRVGEDLRVEAYPLARS